VFVCQFIYIYIYIYVGSWSDHESKTASELVRSKSEFALMSKYEVSGGLQCCPSQPGHSKMHALRINRHCDSAQWVPNGRMTLLNALLVFYFSQQG
jgi:hypothetical protein